MIKLNKEDFKTRLSHLGNTIECGLHSGIPLCCVHYYATKWLWKTSSEKWARWDKVHKTESKMGIKGWGYVPCPKCLKKKNVVKKLNRCQCYHGEECSGED